LEVENPVSKVLEKGLIVGLANHTVLIRKDSAEVSIDDSGAPIKDKNGKTTGVVLIFRDITKRKKAEEAFRGSEQRLKFHAENIPLAVVEWDRNFVVTRWAGEAEKMFGWSSSETIGKPIMDLHLIYEPDIPIVEKTMGKLTSGETKVVSSNRNITRDGRVIYCTWYNSVLLDENGKMASVFSFVEDYTSKVTAEKALEENNKNLEKLVDERTKQLRDSERLAAIGATAGMVGHDIRNPLQAITGDVYLAKTELSAIPESSEKQNTLESLQEIEKNIDYINKIVADLQDFARPLKPHLEAADLKQIIGDLLAKNGLPENIKVSVKVDAEARKVLADSAYINRIMYNLVTNAVQAMPNGGKLTIHAFKDKKTDEAVITVADTGVGIPEAVKDKLFTPMFTTKSKGQGFGLAVIKRMAVALNGSVTFESEEGNGTKFTVRFPQKLREKKTDF
jgi:PAS domain S-box-containing protein